VSKARRKKTVKVSKKPTSSTGLMLAVIGVSIIVVVGLVYVTGRAGSKPIQVPTTSEQGYEIGITPEGFPYKGAADAPVVFEAYSDYKCGHCQDFAMETEPLIDQAYVATGKVKFVSHYFGFSAETQALATAAMCAAEQGKFWEFDQTLFANQVSTSASTVSVLAHDLGLDVNAFNQCVQSAANKAKIQKYTSQAQAAGITGTPTFFVNGKEIVGAQPFERFQEEIEQALTGAQ